MRKARGYAEGRGEGRNEQTGKFFKGWQRRRKENQGGKARIRGGR